MSSQKKRVIISIVIIILVGLIIKNIRDSISFNNNGVYVIGKIDTVQGARGGMRVFVTYQYKGRIFHGDYIEGDFKGKYSLVKRHFFKIDSSNPNCFDIEYTVRVPDSLKYDPYSGWDSLPQP